mgnify:CR=1 FL=1
MRHPHPWWHHLPPERRNRTEHTRLLWRRVRSWLRLRRQRLLLTISFYLVLCMLPMLFGLPFLGVVALMPLLLIPPIGFLLYWLVWKDYHH